MFWERISVDSQERVLVARNHQVKTILTPGKHTAFNPPFVRLELERHDITDLVFQSKWTRHLVSRAPRLVEQHFVCVQTNEVEVAMVYADGRLLKVLAPFSRVLIWRDVAEITVESVQVIGDFASDDQEAELEFPIHLARATH